MAGNAYAHKSEVVGDYKIEAGWKNEPPVAGIDNAIEVVVSQATDFEKSQSDSEEHHHTHDDESMDMEHGDTHDGDTHDGESMTHDEMDDDHKETSTEHDHESGEKISGLSDSLNVWVTIGDHKTKVSLVESSEFPGVYYGDYLPIKTGHPIVDVHGMIETTDIDVQMHPEEVEPLSTLAPLKQMKNGIDPEDVMCKDGLDLFMRIGDNSAMCISSKFSETLMNSGMIDYF